MASWFKSRMKKEFWSSAKVPEAFAGPTWSFLPPAAADWDHVPFSKLVLNMLFLGNALFICTGTTMVRKTAPSKVKKKAHDLNANLTASGPLPIALTFWSGRREQALARTKAYLIALTFSTLASVHLMLLGTKQFWLPDTSVSWESLLTSLFMFGESMLSKQLALVVARSFSWCCLIFFTQIVKWCFATNVFAKTGLYSTSWHVCFRSMRDWSKWLMLTRESARLSAGRLSIFRVRPSVKHRFVQCAFSKFLQ